MSTLSDAAGAEDDRGKGGTPKRKYVLSVRIWAYGEESYDCHPTGWGAT